MRISQMLTLIDMTFYMALYKVQCTNALNSMQIIYTCSRGDQVMCI